MYFWLFELKIKCFAKQHNSVTTVGLQPRDNLNCIQHFHLGIYGRKFGFTAYLFTVKKKLFHLKLEHCKLHNAASHPKKCDITNNVSYCSAEMYFLLNLQVIKQHI